MNVVIPKRSGSSGDELDANWMALLLCIINEDFTPAKALSAMGIKSGGSKNDNSKTVEKADNRRCS